MDTGGDVEQRTGRTSSGTPAKGQHAEGDRSRAGAAARRPDASDPGDRGTSAQTRGAGAGLVGVLVPRDTGSTVVACGFLVDVFCLGVKNTNGPKTMDRRKFPDFTRT